MLNYKIQRILLNPHRIKYFHEADSISNFLNISGNWKGSGHEDFSTLMLELGGEKDPDIYFQSREGKKNFCECLVKTEAYNRWREAWETQEAYRRLSILGKLSYHIYGLYIGIIKYPSRSLSYWCARISGFVEYRIRIENYKRDVENRFERQAVDLSEANTRISLLENKVFGKMKKKKKKPLKKFKRVSYNEPNPESVPGEDMLDKSV